MSQRGEMKMWKAKEETSLARKQLKLCAWWRIYLNHA